MHPPPPPPSVAAAADDSASLFHHPGHLAHALQLPPLAILVSRIRNAREADLILHVASAASSFDSLFHTYLSIAAASHSLQTAWDALWLAQEPNVVAAIPILGAEMSRFNWARGRLMHKMEGELQNLESCAKALRHFVEVNATVAEELRMEGVDRLAADKERLVEMERGIERRFKVLACQLLKRRQKQKQL